MMKPQLRSGLFALGACFLGLASAAKASPGDLDTTFSGDGKVTTSSLVEGASVAMQGTKILVTGQGGTDPWQITRFLSNGSVDTTFGTSGTVTTTWGTGVGAISHSLVVQSDGKFLVCGYAYGTGIGGDDFAVARYNSDGTLDTSFSGDGKIIFNFVSGSNIEDARAMAITSTGKIVVVGGCDYDGAIARLNSDGTLDTTFHGDGKRTTVHTGGRSFNIGYEGVALDSSDKIIVTGTYGNDFTTARYLTNGSLDTAFDSDGIVTTDIAGLSRLDIANSVAVDSSGNVIVVGGAGYGTHSGANTAIAMVKYNSSGALVSGFGTSGVVINDFGTSVGRLNAVKLDSSGKIVAAGVYNDNFIVLRYTSAGALDTTFSGDGIMQISFAQNEFGESLALQSDGKIVVSGISTGTGSYTAIARLEGDAVSPIKATPPTSISKNGPSAAQS